MGLSCSEESILRHLWWDQQAVMLPLAGLARKRDEVSRSIERPVAGQPQQTQLTPPVNKMLHCTGVNCLGFGTEGHCCLPCLHLLEEISPVWDKSVP